MGEFTIAVNRQFMDSGRLTYDTDEIRAVCVDSWALKAGKREGGWHKCKNSTVCYIVMMNLAFTCETHKRISSLHAF